MSANDRQVGGTHYKTYFQHWDLATEFGLGYFEGQISKYFTRHRSKKGLEDAQKGVHMIMKMSEEFSLKRWHPHHSYRHSAIRRVNEYAVANKLTDDERNIVGLCVTWTNQEHLTVLIMCARRIISETYENAFDPVGNSPFERPSPAVEQAVVNAVLHTPAHHATQAQFDAAVDRRDMPSGARPPSDFDRHPYLKKTDGSEPDGSYVNQGDKS